MSSRDFPYIFIFLKEIVVSRLYVVVAKGRKFYSLTADDVASMTE